MCMLTPGTHLCSYAGFIAPQTSLTSTRVQIQDVRNVKTVRQNGNLVSSEQRALCSLQASPALKGHKQGHIFFKEA